MDFEHATLIDLAAAIRAREVSSEEVTRAALERLRLVHQRCNAVVEFEDHEAILAARAADAVLARGETPGPLHGVPLAHKDMFDRKGKIASRGARIRAAEPAVEDATVLARLAAAGALQIATLHLTEFAFGPTGHNYVLGHARNPWNREHITGGSSSGPAVSVATGAVPAALGSDTAGSLRLPASACGIVSLKPTWTRVSAAGAMPLAPSLDAVGPMARRVSDLALLLGILAGHDPRDGYSSRRAVPDYAALAKQPAEGLRLGVDEVLLAQAHPQIQARLERALQVLERAGCRLVSVCFPEWRTLDHLTQILQLSEVASEHGQYLRTRAAEYGPQVRARLEAGHFISGADYQTASRARGMLLETTLNQTYGECDVTILPNFADPLPTIGELDVGGGPALQAMLARVVLFTRPINYLGLPAITLPYAREGGLPNGFQIVGRPFQESTLIALGCAYQAEVPPELAPIGH